MVCDYSPDFIAGQGRIMRELNRVFTSALIAVVLCSPFWNSSARALNASENERRSVISESSPDALAPLYERFKVDAKELSDGRSGAIADGEVPDFQKHISPLFGRLGCNGRACHGSFQGQGGFQLSLFGYDFEADYQALLEEGAARVDLEDQLESLILTKPVDADMHDGGKRYEHGEWEYWVLRKWIEAGAPFEKEAKKLERLEVQPVEVQFASEGETADLRVLAHWEDGVSEDVTCLCRFTTNDEAVAMIDDEGRVKAGSPGDTHVVVSYDKAVVPIPVLRPVGNAKPYATVAAETEVDRLVLKKLRKLGIEPSEKCSDEDFLRRASLDVNGTLPSVAEIEEFIANDAPDKRERKIEELLSRPTYAAQWTTFLCDMTGNNDDQLRNFLPQRVNPSSHWYQWIYKRVAENVPYDELVEGIVVAQSRNEGESYQEYCEEMSDICRDKSGEAFADRPGLVYYWARNNFRSPEDRAIGFAYSFLGVRIQCAQCHKHPFDQWSKDDFDQFEKLFTTVRAQQNTVSSESKREYQAMLEGLDVDKKLKGNQLRQAFAKLLDKGEVVPLPELVINPPRASRNKKRGTPAPPPTAKLLGGATVDMTSEDVRGDLMEWLRAPENPYFTKAIVNRVWAQYFGIGIVDPADDLNLANAPSNAELLNYLADGFRENNFNLKWLHREILRSDTYQMSWKTNATNQHDKKNFSHALLRRLPAESTYDAVRMALANSKLAEQGRELEASRAITKPGSSARATRQDDESYALRVFGRSIRESNCDCDRSSEPSLLQTVFLANDSAVQKWLNDPKQSWVAEVAKKYGWSMSSVNSQLRREQAEKSLVRFANQLADVDSKLKAAKKSENSRQLKFIKKRRTEMIKKARSIATKQGFESELELVVEGADPSEVLVSGKMDEQQAQWIAENAYLRTLSRKPRPDELSTVIAFLTEDEQPTSAVEGLLWSLINTKEFILNH
ncbi:MAG: DUF1549 and DUF1553 domain-containing protein [Aureliella sp.]